jgi:hypothetical protein
MAGIRPCAVTHRFVPLVVLCTLAATAAFIAALAILKGDVEYIFITSMCIVFFHYVGNERIHPGSLLD